MPDPALSLETLRIGFIGAGRLGKALACSFADRGLRVTTEAYPYGAGSTVVGWATLD